MRRSSAARRRLSSNDTDTEKDIREIVQESEKAVREFLERFEEARRVTYQRGQDKRFQKRGR
jgi:hypothetical protein